MKCEILYFDSHHVCSLKRRKIKDGKIIYDKENHFDIDKVEPLLIDSPWIQFGGMTLFPMIRKTFPLYVVKHDSATPLKMDIQRKTPGLTYYTPKTLVSLAKSATLNTLLTLKPPMDRMIMWLIMGGALGFFMCYFFLGVTA